MSSKMPQICSKFPPKSAKSSKVPQISAQISPRFTESSKMPQIAAEKFSSKSADSSNSPRICVHIC